MVVVVLVELTKRLQFLIEIVIWPQEELACLSVFDVDITSLIDSNMFLLQFIFLFLLLLKGLSKFVI